MNNERRENGTFFEAHDVGDEKQVATPLNSVGASTYGLLRNLVQPLKPKDKTFDEIMEILSDYLSTTKTTGHS